MDTPPLSPIQQQIANRELSEAEHKAKLETEKQLAQDAFKRLDTLKKNPDFIWYMENVIQPLIVIELGASLNINRTKDERDNSAHRHDLGQTIMKALEEQRLFWANQGGIQL